MHGLQQSTCKASGDLVDVIGVPAFLTPYGDMRSWETHNEVLGVSETLNTLL
jgi:hypothetical protein